MTSVLFLLALAGLVAVLTVGIMLARAGETKNERVYREVKSYQQSKNK